jgi:NAD(P)-dependent dehydrogenase (short-subunit alcohol dehydrogenase family)
MLSRTKIGLAVAIGLGLFAREIGRAPRRYALNGKRVLVTGGSRGLGLLLAREFLRRGSRVAIGARDPAELGRARDILALEGYEVEPALCDVTSQQSVDQTIATLSSKWGGIDVVVNNAGVIQTGPIENMDMNDFSEAMRTHFWGPLHMTLAVLPQMKERKDGRIVNIASIGGKISFPHLIPYNASKFALVGLSEGLTAELAKDGIRVTTVCPGLMRTGSPRNALFKGQHRLEFTWFSIADSLPGLSMNAHRAARQIVDACERGRSEVTLSLPAKVGSKVKGLCPGITIELLTLVNRLLPSPGGIEKQRAKGADSTTPLSESALTMLSKRAAHRHNQIA